jgi:phenylalanine-4-hydroxylase
MQTTTAPKVELPEDHPGFSDPAYRARRDAIAAISSSYEAGGAIPDVPYSEVENGVWRTVLTELDKLHEVYAARDFLTGVERLGLPRDRVVQLSEVTERLLETSDFRIAPVPGLVPTRTFYGSLADRTFMSTQYLRHESVPLYTPEPDVIHEIVGHGNMLANRDFADVYQLAGQASRRAETAESLDFFSRVFWFTLEFGVVWEDGELKAYGAGILSSYGEIQVFREAEVRPLDVPAMGTLEYDITKYQPVLYAADSSAHLLDTLADFFGTYDEDAYHRWMEKVPPA